VDVNCSGLKGDLLARELFGNVRGAFTSADRDREGLLDAADKGTLFLDEIGEMDLAVQAQFLKVLEEKTYRRLGDTRQRRSDFRLISATNRQIETALQKGEFRSDLYFRINLLTIHIPPLRERSEDLPEMVRHLLSATPTPQAGITEEAWAILQAYPWPGNIRELKNVLERALILSHGDILTADHFAWLKAAPFAHCPGMPKTLKEMERFQMFVALEQGGGDVARAAKSLGISKATLYRRLKAIKEQS
jgi:transcriptional regulator with PAS, ATPase and Fis domain